MTSCPISYSAPDHLCPSAPDIVQTVAEYLRKHESHQSGSRKSAMIPSTDNQHYGPAAIWSPLRLRLFEPESIGYIPLMAIVSVLYPKTADSRFDHDYYVETHAPLVKARWGGMGLVSATFIRGASQLDGGEHAFEMIGLLTFSTADQLKVALAAHGEEIIADIPNFTNVQPLIQLNQAVEA